MQSYFDKCAAELDGMSSPLEVRTNVLALTRLALQQCCYGMVEWLTKQSLTLEMLPEESCMRSLMSPTDGTLVDALEELLFRCERAGWTGIGTLLARRLERESKAKSLFKGRPPTIDGLLRSLVAIRNDGGEGHGLPGEYDPAAEIDAIRAIGTCLSLVMPTTGAEPNALYAGPAGSKVKLEILKLWSGSPALIRTIQHVGAGRVRIEAQLKTGINTRKPLSYESADPFPGLVQSRPPTFEVSSHDGGNWTPFIFLPARLTDTFSGRHDEVSAIADWLDDSDSRTCMVFGDGGLGKTTLVVEFLTRWLEGSIKTTWRPDFISFYTAKRWVWSLDGMVPVRAGVPHVHDLISHLHTLFFDELPDKSWFRLGVKEAVAKLANKLSEIHHFKRDDHLIVIDNAETLIESEQDREKLAAELKDISRRLGRVIVTSRRREQVEAAPVEVRPLSARESVNLVKSRGLKLLNLEALRSASDEDLLVCVRDLGGRPLVLDAFLRALSDPSTNTIRRAVDRVNRMLARDLGAFLFEDAWYRLDPKIRRLMLVMVQLGDVHDAVRLRLCCQLAQLPVSLAEAALEESAGIASVSRFDGQLQIEFSNNFMQFASEKSVAFAEEQATITKAEIEEVKRRYSDYLKSNRQYVGGRLPQAYRHPEARAAWTATTSGRIDDARHYYEQATLSDSNNGWLFDRYAFFLMKNCHDLRSALLMARRATELLPREGEVWLTRGVIEGRLGERQDFESSLDKAEGLGVLAIRCALQKAWGYTRTRPPQVALSRKQLDIAKLLIQQDKYADRNIVEIGRIEDRIASFSKRSPTPRKAGK
jgi:hypothetical protein